MVDDVIFDGKKQKHVVMMFWYFCVGVSQVIICFFCVQSTWKCLVHSTG